MQKQTKKAIASLGTILVLVLAVGIYDQVVRPKEGVLIAGLPRNLNEMNRSIANVKPVRDKEEIEWEHALAERLKEAKGILERGPANYGRSPNAVEELRYGVLRGKYRLQLSEGAKIQEISFIEATDSGEQPIHIEGVEFLKTFQQEFSVKFVSTKLISKEDQSETYSLMDANQGPAGTATFKRDEQGRLLNFRVSAK